MSFEELIGDFCDRLKNIKDCIDLMPIFTGDDERLLPRYLVLAKDAVTLASMIQQLKTEKQMTSGLYGELKMLTIEANLMNKEIEDLMLDLPAFLPAQQKSNVLTEKEKSVESKENVAPGSEGKSSNKKTASGKASQGNKRGNPPSLAYITAAEFGSVPGYMKGRLLYSEVNKAIDIFNRVAQEKYKIVNLPKSKSNTDYQRRKMVAYLEQETVDTDGTFFITDEDIKEFSEAKLDRHFQSIVTILRHCTRIRQIRTGSIVRHILSPSSG